MNSLILQANVKVFANKMFNWHRNSCLCFHTLLSLTQTTTHEQMDEVEILENKKWKLSQKQLQYFYIDLLIISNTNKKNEQMRLRYWKI